MSAQRGTNEATSITWDTLRALASFRASTGCAVSFYLDLDPQVTPTAADVRTRVRALVDESGKRADATRERRAHARQASVREALEQIRRWFETEFTREGSRGVAVFSAPRDGLWRQLPLPAPVPDGVKFGKELFVAPLVPLAGEGGGVLVAVVGRERGDLYELQDGRLKAVLSRFDEQPRRHDQGGWSQANYQRHIDNLADRHLRAVAAEIERELRRRTNARLVVACAEETRTELFGLLSPGTRAALAGWTRAEAHAAGDEVLASVKPVLERNRAQREEEIVARWHEALGQSGRASAGWDATIDAASDGRVDTLLCAPGADHDLHCCPSCGRLELATGTCPLDGAEVEQCEDGLDALVHRTLELGGWVHPIVTRRDLEPVGGVGALLRF